MSAQLTNTILMVRPDTFGFNPETAVTNHFQHTEAAPHELVAKQAIQEFEQMVATLKSHTINVVVIPSPEGKITPDAVFPNNWVSFHENGTMVVYPMLAPNRRLERQPNVVKLASGGAVRNTVDLTHFEQEGEILEGTGSLVLDRVHKIAYAALSPRTTKALTQQWCQMMGYEPVMFLAVGDDGTPIYHTNVVMGVGDGFVVVCLESIKDSRDRDAVVKKIEERGVTLIDITHDQLYAFCGNLLHVVGEDGKKYIVMSQTACDAFTSEQKKILETFGEIIPVSIPTIETIGGGSARCMMAEVFI